LAHAFLHSAREAGCVVGGERALRVILTHSFCRKAWLIYVVALHAYRPSKQLGCARAFVPGPCLRGFAH